MKNPVKVKLEKIACHYFLRVIVVAKVWVILGYFCSAVVGRGGVQATCASVSQRSGVGRVITDSGRVVKTQVGRSAMRSER